jgi:predicted alpha/beta-hydrolase family hydrolase
MRPHVEGLARRGVSAAAVDLPRGRAEQAVAAFLAVSGSGPEIVVGGQSYGGRVASLAAAEHPFAALVCFSYPLHRPGQPDGQARTAHWPRIRCPVLLLSGEKDPLARVDLLREAVGRLPQGTLVTYPGAGHSMKGPVLEQALDAVAAFLATLPTI